MNLDKSEEEQKKHLLYELGKAIRSRAVDVRKRHGSFWVLKLQSKILFYHDDYNGRVRAVFPNGTNFYYGISFGGFESVCSVNHFLATIELVKHEKLVDVSDDEMRLVYTYG